MIKKFLESLKSRGYTQEQIAEKVGLGQSYISHLMNGKNCSLETVIKFADAFGVSLDEVVGRTPPEKKPLSNSLKDHGKGLALKG
ncbi:helix-turn-helix transcriptional regulator [Geomonas sp. Red69]|uniref:helix-turn-helix domain-containing protein n=1 Tax=Geomonas diazotrophica TaxID=2843197 RepID=UPI001C11B248|nr:helix-turn-helix transcriptional regulator [Geomonas diazotrophica]MBU5637063.1 helix-turn-helix transcriptional regulator [Geomonas diazotrophica]